MMRRTPLKRGASLKIQGFARTDGSETREVTKIVVKEKKLRTRKCAVPTCRQLFPPRSMTHKTCGPECAQEYVRLEKVRKDRRERQAGLLKLKPRKWFLAKAKKAMHLYVRTRDEGKPCCSCDTVLIRVGRVGGDYDAGHLRSVGSAKHLEFDPRNVWGQCKYCNDRLHGNEREYERRLRLLEGDAMVDSLMADNDERHLKNSDFLLIEAHYKKLLKELP